MLDFCGKHNITADVEVIPIQKVNEAYERLLKSDVKYAFPSIWLLLSPSNAACLLAKMGTRHSRTPTSIQGEGMIKRKLGKQSGSIGHRPWLHGDELFLRAAQDKQEMISVLRAAVERWRYVL